MVPGQDLLLLRTFSAPLNAADTCKFIVIVRKVHHLWVIVLYIHLIMTICVFICLRCGQIE